METFGKLSKSLPSMLEWVLALLLEPTAQDSMSILKKMEKTALLGDFPHRKMFLDTGFSWIKPNLRSEHFTKQYNLYLTKNSRKG